MIDRRAVWLALGTATTWGFAGTFIRLLADFPALFVTGYRLAIAIIALAPVLWIRRSLLPMRDLRRHSTYKLGLLLVAYYLTSVLAFQMAPVAEVALLIASSPLLVLGANAIRGISLTRGERLGAILACIGVAFVLGPKLSPGNFHASYLVGELLAILCAGCSATFATIFGTSGTDEHPAPDPFLVAVTAMLLGGVGLTTTSAATTHIDFARLVEPKYLIPALGLGVVSTAFPSVAYSSASRRLPAVLTTTIQLLIPVVSTIAAAVVLREFPSVWAIPGGLLVLGGIYILVRSAKSPQIAVEEELTNV